MSLLDKLTADDLDETQRELADCIGMEAYRKLVATYAGETITIRMPDRLTICLRNDDIRSEYNGYNISELARRYNMHPNTIRRIVSEIRSEKRNEQLPEQLDLFSG